MEYNDVCISAADSGILRDYNLLDLLGEETLHYLFLCQLTFLHPSPPIFALFPINIFPKGYTGVSTKFRMCEVHFLGLNKSFIFFSTALSLQIWKSYQFMPISSQNRPRFILRKTPKISVFQCHKITLSITVPLFDRTQDSGKLSKLKSGETLESKWKWTPLPLTGNMLKLLVWIHIYIAAMQQPWLLYGPSTPVQNT